MQVLSAEINGVSKYYMDATIGFGYNLESIMGVYVLLHAMNTGLTYAEERHKRIQSGDYDIDDLKQVEW